MRLSVYAAAVLLVGSMASPALAQRQFAQNWQDLGPRERFDAMRNYQQHRQLPEDRQRDVEDRYDRWQQMPPDEQSRIRRNYDRLQHLDPQERNRFDKRYEKWKQRTAPRQ